MTTEPRASLVEVDLLPCPFCGGKARLEIGKMVFEDAEVSCDGCGSSGPNHDDGFGREDNARLATAAWNTRHRLEALRTQGDGEARAIVNDYQRLAFDIVGRRLPVSIQIGFISKEQCPVIDGDHADGFTLFPDDGSDPEIWIGNHVPIMGVPDTLFHEAAHVIAGLEADHGPEWQAANEALWAEMNGILAAPTQASSREEG